MTDIVLSRPKYCGVTLKKMDRTLLAACLAPLAREKQRRIYCHGNWSQSHGELEWLVGEVDRQGLLLTICLLPEDLESLTPLMKNGRKFEISLATSLATSGESGEPVKLPEGAEVNFFLPLSQPDPQPEILIAALPFMTNSATVTLGIGWSNRLSGPGDIAEGDHPAWARAILAIVDLLCCQNEGRQRQKLKIQLACGLKLCLFDRLQLGELVTKCLSWPIAMCPRSLAIMPDGSLQPCLRLQLPTPITISPLTVLADVAAGIDQWLAPFAGHCCHADDLSCRSLRVKSCATGCLQHTLQAWSR